MPVLRRPHRVEPTLESVAAAAHGARVLFIPDPDDLEEQRAIRAAGADMLPVDGNYARKINQAVRHARTPLIFTGADDLAWHAGWLDAALATGAPVVGVNDLLPRRPSRAEHATHFLLTREYALLPTIDGGPGPFHEGYSHWCVDDELIGTAQHRGAYAYAPDAVVEHLHPFGGKAEWDDTYERGHAMRRADRALFRQRRRMWTT